MILENLFSKTLTGYLQTADAVTSGLPPPPALNYKADFERADKERPVLTVKVEREKQNHPELAILVCTFTIEINEARDGLEKADDSGKVHYTDPKVAGDWMKALRSHLNDKEKLTSHFDAIPESDRTGWKFMLHYLEPHYKPELDEKEAAEVFEQVLRLTLRIIEGT